MADPQSEEPGWVAGLMDRVLTYMEAEIADELLKADKLGAAELEQNTVCALFALTMKYAVKVDGMETLLHLVGRLAEDSRKRAAEKPLDIRRILQSLGVRPPGQ